MVILVAACRRFGHFGISQNKIGGFETNTFTFGVGAPFALSIKDILAAIDTTLKMYYIFGHINVMDGSNVVV